MHSVDFFDTQFQRQLSAGEFVLNPFETLALPYLEGHVLDLGCGLGNLAIAAARRGCRVDALDGSPTAIDHIRQLAARERLPIQARVATLEDYHIEDTYDAIVCIGLLMFFPEAAARRMLDDIREHVCPGGLAVINLLTDGTTFMDMFQPGHFHLLSPGEVKTAFPGWQVLGDRQDRYPAPGARLKVFDTVILRKPS